MWWRWAHLPSSDAPDLAASMAAGIWALPDPAATTAAWDGVRSIFLHAKHTGGDDDGSGTGLAMARRRRVRRRRPRSAAAKTTVAAGGSIGSAPKQGRSPRRRSSWVISPEAR